MSKNNKFNIKVFSLSKREVSKLNKLSRKLERLDALALQAKDQKRDYIWELEEKYRNKSHNGKKQYELKHVDFNVKLYSDNAEHKANYWRKHVVIVTQMSIKGER